MVDNGTHTSNSSRRRFVKSAGAAGAVLLAGCSEGNGNGGNGQQGDKILIGHLSPFSGGLGWAGEETRKGIETAMADINSAGVLGQEVEYTSQDTESSPQAALQGFETLNSRGVTAIVGPTSATATSVAQPIIDAEVAMITPYAGTSQLDDVHGGYIWRTVSSDSVGGQVQAKYMLDQGWDRVARSFLNEQGPQSFSSAFADYFEANGGTVTAVEQLNPGADSYSSNIQSMTGTDPDAIVMIAGTETTELFVRNYRQRGVDLPLMLGDDTVTPDIIDSLGDAAEGLLAQSSGSTELYEEFATKYRDLHGEEPGTWPHTAYDSMNLIALALQNAGEVSRQAVADNLREVASPEGTQVSTFSEGKAELEAGNEIDYQGAGTNCNFDDQGNVVGPMTIVEVQNGEWTEIKKIQLEELE